MKRPFLVLGAAAAMLAGNAHAQGAGAPAVNAATAARMIEACIAYAEARNGAVNVWIYDGNGSLLQFRRMDGAPPLGVMPGGLSGFGLGSGLIDPTGMGAPEPGDAPVEADGRTIATVRAAGMGIIADRACARAAAAAIAPAER